MSDTKWSVSKFAGQHVRCEPRGPTGTVLRPLEFDAAQPLDPGVQSRLIADISARLTPALAMHGDVQRYVLLRRKKATIERQHRDAELRQQQTTAERERHILAALQEDSGERLAQLDADLRGIGHQLAGCGGMLRALTPEIDKAKAAAERALKQSLGAEVGAAIERACAARDRLLAELCDLASGKLDEIATNVQEMAQLVRGSDGIFLLMRGMLDSLELPADAPKDAAPMPPEEPAATTDAGVRVQLPSGGYAGQVSLPAEATNYTLTFMDPAASAPQPPANEEQTEREDDPTGEPRAKGRRRPVRAE